VRRGWTIPYKYLSEGKQRTVLTDYGVEERVIYSGRAEWPAFVLALRSDDEAVVADLRIFGSRKALREAVNEVEARDAVLVSAATDTCVDPVTLREVHRIETAWAGERSMGGSKRARELSARGLAAYRKKLEESRIPKAEAEAKWHDVENYPNRADALKAMPGWTLMTAWRAFGAREK
jgi:hypothetical protein